MSVEDNNRKKKEKESKNFTKSKENAKSKEDARRRGEMMKDVLTHGGTSGAMGFEEMFEAMEVGEICL